MVNLVHEQEDRTAHSEQYQRAANDAGSVAIFAGGTRGARGYSTWHDMEACDAAYHDITGLACGRRHAIWPWPDQKVHKGGRDYGDAFLAKA